MSIKKWKDDTDQSIKTINGRIKEIPNARKGSIQRRGKDGEYAAEYFKQDVERILNRVSALIRNERDIVRLTTHEGRHGLLESLNEIGKLLNVENMPNELERVKEIHKVCEQMDAIKKIIVPWEGSNESHHVLNHEISKEMMNIFKENYGRQYSAWWSLAAAGVCFGLALISLRWYSWDINGDNSTWFNANILLFTPSAFFARRYIVNDRFIKDYNYRKYIIGMTDMTLSQIEDPSREREHINFILSKVHQHPLENLGNNSSSSISSIFDRVKNNGSCC